LEIRSAVAARRLVASIRRRVGLAIECTLAQPRPQETRIRGLVAYQRPNSQECANSLGCSRVLFWRSRGDLSKKCAIGATSGGNCAEIAVLPTL
jgi:hypothetical protein